MALTIGLFVFGIIGAQEQHGLQYGNAYTRSQFRNASSRKGTLLILVGGIISSKLEAFCVKRLLPLPEKESSLS